MELPGAGLPNSPTQWGKKLACALAALLLVANAWANHPLGRLRVDLRGAIPDILRLERATPSGWVQVDSAWQLHDGFYHFAPRKGQAIYQLVHAVHSEPIPLCWNGTEEIVIRSWGEAMLDSASVISGNADTRAYLLTAQAAERHRRITLHLNALALIAHDDCGDLIDTAHRRIERRMQRELQGIMSSTSEGVRALCQIMMPSVERQAKGWWARGLLEAEAWSGLPAIARHLDDYILSHRSPSYTKQQQDSAYWSAIQKLAAERMAREMAQWLRSLIVYNFSGSDYDALADSVTRYDFGPLRGAKRATTRSEVRYELQGKKLRSLSGDLVPLVDRERPLTLLLFWSVWCGHCQSMLPTLAEWVEQQAEQAHIAVRAISVDTWSQELQSHIATRGWSWINAVDEALADEMQIDSTPTLLLLDSLGNIVDRPASIEQLKAKIRQTLSSPREKARRGSEKTLLPSLPP